MPQLVGKVLLNESIRNIPTLEQIQKSPSQSGGYLIPERFFLTVQPHTMPFPESTQSDLQKYAQFSPTINQLLAREIDQIKQS